MDALRKTKKNINNRAKKYFFGIVVFDFLTIRTIEVNPKRNKCLIPLGNLNPIDVSMNSNDENKIITRIIAFKKILLIKFCRYVYYNLKFDLVLSVKDFRSITVVD